MQLKGIVDRIESGSVIIELETGLTKNYDMPNFLLKEGDSVVIEGHQIVFVDSDETERRKKEIQALMDELFAD